MLAFVPALVTAQTQTPQQVADELLAADRAYSAASAKTDLISGIAAMFADDVARIPRTPGPSSNGRRRVLAFQATDVTATPLVS